METLPRFKPIETCPICRTTLHWQLIKRLLQPMATPARSPATLPYKIGFIGAGQMALALAKGFMASGLIAPSQVMASAPSNTNLLLWEQLDADTTHNNLDVLTECDVIFLAVKPNIYPRVMAELISSAARHRESNAKNESDSTSPIIDDDKLGSLNEISKLFVSVMAGVTLESLASNLKSIVTQPRIIRATPNTPAMIGCGCAVFSLGEGATLEDGELVRILFNSVGVCEMIPESQQDAFTGMAGSGPAYVYTFLEALADGGVRMGLPRSLATKFAAQMTLGAAKMSLDSGKHTGQLKDEVTSPGGTTIRGIQVLERGGFRGLVMEAVQASAERATELGKKDS